MTKQKTLTEKQVVSSCRAWFKRNGWEPFTIYTGGIPTYNGQMVPNPCAGIPDSINFNKKLQLTVWVEYKSSIGKLKENQEEWRDRLQEHGNIWLEVNSLESLKTQIAQVIKEWEGVIK